MTSEQIHAFWLAKLGSPDWASILLSLSHVLVFLAKVKFWLMVYIWIRWTLPRFRFDQLMNLGWKTMLPWALANLAITAVVMFMARG